MTSVTEYDGPTAWVDMTAVEKMEGVLAGEFTDVDELELYRQAIREARSDAAVMTAISAELRESQAEVARLRADAERYCWLRDHGRTPDHEFDEIAWSDACNALSWTKSAEAIDAAVDRAMRASRKEDTR